jgi:hypothetical protein
MENAEPLIPLAIKESTAFRVAALMQEGYIRVGDPIRCPLCGERFLLLIDPKDRSDFEAVPAARTRNVIAFFQKTIMRDHINYHPHWQFRMTER